MIFDHKSVIGTYLLNNGRYVKISAIQAAFNPYSNKIERIDSLESKQIYSPQNVRIITSAMTHTIEGTAKTIKPILPKDRTYYIKTGTSDRGIHGYCVLSDGKVLIVSFLTYGKVIGSRLELNDTPAIPFKSGGRTATVLAADIYNELTVKH